MSPRTRQCEKRRKRLPAAAALPVALLTSLLAGVAIGGGRAVLAGGWQHWLVEGLLSPLSLTCAAVAGACAAAGGLLAVRLWRIGASARRRVGTAEGGGAMIEFAIALPILLTLSLVMLQASLLMGGNLCVHYAAWCGARSAAVHIPAALPNAISPVEGPNELFSGDASSKRRKVQLAAAWAVMPISPGASYLPAGDDAGLTDEIDRLFSFYGRETPDWMDDRIRRKLQYALDHTRVKIAPPAGAEGYAPHEDIRVDVAHTLRLSVPYAARAFAALSEDGVRLEVGENDYGLVIRAGCTVRNEGPQDWVDREEFHQQD